MEKFNFGEALSMMQIGETVCLELDGKVRRYSIEDGRIVCRVGENVTYIVTKFYTDAVLSEEWYLYE